MRKLLVAVYLVLNQVLKPIQAKPKFKKEIIYEMYRGGN